MRKSALGRLLKPLFNLDDVEFPTENLLTPLKEGSNEVNPVFVDELERVQERERSGGADRLLRCCSELRSLKIIGRAAAACVSGVCGKFVAVLAAVDGVCPIPATACSLRLPELAR